MKLRHPALAVLAVLPVLTATACGIGSHSPAGTGKARDVRTALAKTYWKVHAALPDSLDVSDGKGKFVTCSKKKPDLAVYRVENMIDAKDGKETAAQLLAQLRAALTPGGWNLVLDKVQPFPTHTASMSKTTAYVANQDGMQLQLLLQERTSDVDAGGFLDLYSKCADLGKDQKDILGRYAPGTSSDDYRPTAASARPIPTGFPTPVT